MITYEPIANKRDLIDRLIEIAPRTVIVDVEPIVASWKTNEAILLDGITSILDQLSDIDRLRFVVFSTNSNRRLALAAHHKNLAVSYLAAAYKPLRTSHYRGLPSPGVVIGDQVATDGILAWRLGYTFMHYCPDIAMPLGSRLMRMLGYVVRGILFRHGK